MTTEQFRPRRSKNRRARRLRVAPPRLKLTRRQAAIAAGAALVLGGGAGVHFFQLSAVHDLEAAASEAALDPALSGPFHDDPVFTGPEWTARQVMVSASVATERLAHAEKIEAMRDSVWLPWLSGRADTAADAYFAADPDAQFTAEFTQVVAQTKAACEAPQTGLPVQSFIDSWSPAGAADVDLRAGQGIPPTYAADVMTAAYRSAMQAGLTYMCPDAVSAPAEAVPEPVQQDTMPEEAVEPEAVTDTL